VALEFRPETAMWTAVIIMGDPLNESAFQVSLGKRNAQVQAFSPDSAHQSFATGLCHTPHATRQPLPIVLRSLSLRFTNRLPPFLVWPNGVMEPTLVSTDEIRRAYGGGRGCTTGESPHGDGDFVA
jgi:hypothetical protein